MISYFFQILIKMRALISGIISSFFNRMLGQFSNYSQIGPGSATSNPRTSNQAAMHQTPGMPSGGGQQKSGPQQNNVGISGYGGGKGVSSLNRAAFLSCAFSGFLIAPINSWAEGNCPPGYYPQSGPGFQGCAPGPAINDGDGTRAVIYDGYWETTWGSLAASRTTDNAAVSVTGQRSEKEAERVALQECRKKGGGGGCQVDYTYYNYCVAVANSPSGGFVDGGQTENDAASSALRKCQGAGKGCLIVLADCSRPIYHKN
jgi:hypothetical protein